MKKIDLSIIIAHYLPIDNQKLNPLIKTLESINSQKNNYNIEIIIADDGSDYTNDIINNFSKKKSIKDDKRDIYISNNKKINENTLKNNGYKTMKDLANEVFLGKKTLSSLKVKSTFTLSPPKGGFLRSTRRMYAQGGILGKNPQINDIVLKMI